MNGRKFLNNNVLNLSNDKALMCLELLKVSKSTLLCELIEVPNLAKKGDRSLFIWLDRVLQEPQAASQAAIACYLSEDALARW